MRWTKHEDMLLKRLYHDGKTRDQIAKIMGINRNRVNCRMSILKLASERVEGSMSKPVLQMLAAGYAVSDVAATFGITESRVVEIKKDSVRGRTAR